MSTASGIPAVIDALVASFKSTLGTEAVLDGPGVTEDAPPSGYVIVGMSDPDAEILDEAASSTQGWAWLGHTTRDETITVKCVAVAWNGDGDQKAARDAAFAVVKSCTDAIESDPTYGVSTPGIPVIWVIGLTSTHLRQTQDDMGALATVSFDVELKVRLI